MSEIYTGFSNYKEINIDKRKNAVIKETENWGLQKDSYIQYRSMWKKASVENYTPLHPLHVDIELNNTCNLRCRMCAHGFGSALAAETMAIEKVRSIIDQCSTIPVYAIKLNWRGEPTLYSHLPQVIEYAKKRGILEVMINTNGNPPRKGILIECAEAGIDRIIFSIDGFSKKTYESIRENGSFVMLHHTVFELLQWKKQHSSKKPFLRVQCVRTKENAHQMPSFLEFWNELMDDVRISDVMNRGQGDFLTVGDQITCGRCRCPQPFQRIVIASDGKVSPCCSDWFQEYIIGDIEKSTIQELWMSEAMGEMRRIQGNILHNTLKICQNCSVKESYIWKMKNENNRNNS